MSQVEAATRSSFARYLRLLGVQIRTSTTTGMQYRTDFVAQGLIALLGSAVTLLPILVLFSSRPTVAGWTYPEALLVVGWFVLLKAVLEGAVSPSLTAVVEHVRTGTLDFVLLKPADAQFLMSTARFQPWRAVDLVAAAAIFGYAFRMLGRAPDPAAAAVAVLLLAVGVMVLYSLWILVVSASFWVVRVDNLSYLLGSIFDVARWPVHVFRGALRFVFTFVFPLALMTTYPAMALLGKLAAGTAILAVLGGCCFALLARRVWRRALSHYTSASS